MKYILKRTIFSLLIFSIWVLQSSCQRNEAPASNLKNTDESVDIYENIEFDMPKVVEPNIPDYRVSIEDFGAVGDGLTKNTKAFADAIEAASAKGGGTVVIPRGMWLTGPIILKNNINLHAEKGALIIFSKDFDDYPVIETSFEGLETFRCISPIYGKGLENIAITGAGTFDGSGDAWRPVKKSKLTNSQWKTLVSSGGVLSEDKKTWYPSEKSKKGATNTENFNVPELSSIEQAETVKDFLRPVMVSLVQCKKILIDGPTFQNSPAWNLHPLMSEDITLRNSTIRNPWYSQNGDGLDLESCKNVVIYNNSFDVGDDAICFKSGKDKDGRKRGMPTENVIVKNNIVYHGHGGFVIGSEMSGGVKNVHVSKCTFIGTDVGLRFKSTRGRGGIVENIFISHIDMVDIPTDAIQFNMFYQGNSPVLEEDQDDNDEVPDEKKVAVNEETPIFRNIFMNHIKATGTVGHAAYLQGLPEMSLSNVKLENSILEGNKGIVSIDSEDLLLNNVKIVQESGSALTIYNGKNVDVKGFTFSESKEPAVKVLGGNSENIKFDKDNFNNPSAQVFRGKELEKTVVTID